MALLRCKDAVEKAKSGAKGDEKIGVNIVLHALDAPLPLLLLPGEGSVIYRGLAASIVGGMGFSLIFTLLLLPCMRRRGTAKQVEVIAPETAHRATLESVA